MNMTPGAVRIRLGEILQERNMSVRQLSLMTGIRPNTLGDIANRRGEMRTDHIEKICRALNITPADLILWEETEP